MVAHPFSIGATESEHYRGVSEAVFRLAPDVYTMGEGQGVHGTNERVSSDGYLDMARLYRRLVERAG